ncbi:MAG: threonine/serine exporter family protein [Anaerolineae bacterium]|nr:threonine/serine exporter family protein [Anaerolineae bacterium]
MTNKLQGNDDTPKPPLSREALRDVNDLALWAGQMLLQNGAETARIEETVHRIGTALGCDWLDILVSPNGLLVTTNSGGEFRTRLRRVVHIGVDMAVLDEISTLSHRIDRAQLTRFEVRAELERIEGMKRNYNRWLVAFTVGLACAAFCQLAGGDTAATIITLIASGVAMIVRQELTRHQFNLILTVGGTAFVAGLIASIASVFPVSETPTAALASAVLLLVPGVPLINAAEDLIKGHMVTGIVRGVTGVLISLGIALGLLLAMRLMGVSGL